jgi:hypothetical protein
LLGLNYKVEYKKGIENKAVDALSRREGQSGEICEIFAELKAVSELKPKWMEEVIDSYEGCTWIEGLRKKNQRA